MARETIKMGYEPEDKRCHNNLLECLNQIILPVTDSLLFKKYSNIIFLFVTNCILIPMIANYYSLNFIQDNLHQVVAFIFSIHFLFFAITAIALLHKKISDKWYNISIYIVSCIYFFFFYGKYLHFSYMEGDNICQVAYWNILFHPNLAGSIGAASTKPGQIIISGLLYQLSTIFGGVAFKIGLCIVMASCVWSIVRIATDVGGREAGIIAFPVASLAFLLEFIYGNYSVYLIPVLYVGLWLYFYNPNLKGLGRLLLVLSIQVHIQVIAVLGVIWFFLLLKKDWKELVKLSIYCLFSLGIWVVIILLVQGTFERLDSGTAVGYGVGPLVDPNLASHKIEYIFAIVQAGLTNSYLLRFLFILTFSGIIGALYYGCKPYLIVFSSMIILLINVLFLGGVFSLDRYCSIFYAFGCSVGLGSIVRFFRGMGKNRIVASRLSVAAALFLLIMIFDFSVFNEYENLNRSNLVGESTYFMSAMNVLSDRTLPYSTRLMTEDDLLSPIVAISPDRYPSLTALQYFNVQSESQRKKSLRKIDYILIILNNEHEFYYLTYLPVRAWLTDPFRLMVIDIIKTHQPRYLYGYGFVPIDINSERLILKVEPET